MALFWQAGGPSQQALLSQPRMAAPPFLPTALPRPTPLSEPLPRRQQPAAEHIGDLAKTCSWAEDTVPVRSDHPEGRQLANGLVLERAGLG